MANRSNDSGARLLWGLLGLSGLNLFTLAGVGWSVARGVVTQTDLRAHTSDERARVAEVMAYNAQEHERFEGELRKIWEELALREAKAFREPDWEREQRTLLALIDRLQADIRRLEAGFMRRHGDPLPSTGK